jgi:hypothetical protein
MAAGLGFKDFTTGEVLTAADVDGYLMQGVWVFASAAARDAAVTSPQEGNFAYLKDTNTTTYYTGSAWTNLDTTGMVNPMTTTGDTIYSSSGSTPARLGIGTTGQVLTVAGGVPSWATPAGGATFAGTRLTKSAGQTISNNTDTMVTWDVEDFDVGGYHDNSTNNTRITIPSGKAGYYQINVTLGYAANATGQRCITLAKNGTNRAYNLNIIRAVNSGGYTSVFYSDVVYGAVADYFEISNFQDSGGNLNLIGNNGDPGACYFSFSLIGA